jgi:hypothetical protein
MTLSIDSAKQPADTLRPRLAVPWFTVLLLAAVMAYADGFWMLSMRGATGAIERSDGAFTAWWRESTVSLPVFVVAVLGALLLAIRLFGPVLRTFGTVAGAALLVALAGTVAGIAETAVSSAYDYYLQASQLQMIESMHGICTGNCLAQAQQSSLDVQVRAVLYASGLLLVTNVVLVGWLVAMRGGRLTLATVDRRSDPAIESRGTSGNRVDDVRLLVVVGLLGTAHVHAAQVPVRLGNWPAAAGFFLLLTVAEVAVVGLLLTRLSRPVLLAAVAISIGPIVVYVYSCTIGLPFGPGAVTPEAFSVPGGVACALELMTLLAAGWLLRATATRQHHPVASAHLRGLVIAAVVAVTVIGIAGTAPAWFDQPGDSGPQPVMTHS